MKRRYRLLALLAALALVAAACGGDDSSDTTQASSDGGDSGQVEQVTLRLFDNETGDLSPIWDGLIAEFEAENPGVTIERSSRSFSDFLDTVLLVLSSDDPPDIFQGNAGYSVDGPLIEAGLVLNLDPYEAQYGWNDLFGESALQINSFSEDGQRWGDGPLYGLSPTNEIVGVYYNQTIADELGVTVPPASLADFEASLETAAAAGVLPIIEGNVDKFAGGHLYNVIQNAIAPGQENYDWVLGADGATFVTDGNTEAAAIVQDWAVAGYINEDLNGLGYDDANAQFLEGAALYRFGGSWLVSGLEAGEIGFFAMPRPDGDPPAATGALSSPLHVSTATANPDIAVKFIDFMTNANAAAKLSAAGQVPAATTGGSFADGSLGQDVATALGQVAAGGVLVPFLDFALSSPEPIVGPLQELFADRITPEEWVQGVQEVYESEQQ